NRNEDTLFVPFRDDEFTLFVEPGNRDRILVALVVIDKTPGVAQIGMKKQRLFFRRTILEIRFGIELKLEAPNHESGGIINKWKSCHGPVIRSAPKLFLEPTFRTPARNAAAGAGGLRHPKPTLG